MVDNPIQRGNWFSSLRAWHARRARDTRRQGAASGERPALAEAAAPRAAGEVELSRMAMAAPFED